MKKIISLILLSVFIYSPIAQAKAEKLTVILDWFPNPSHAPLLVAKKMGFFKAEGLDVTLIGPADPTDPPKLVAAGKADVGITYEPEYMQQVDRGLPLIAIGQLIDTPLNCLVTLKETGIDTIAELKGKTIGSSSSSGLSSLLLKTLLKNANLTIDDIKLVNVHYNLTQALLSKRVDAVTGMGRNVEVPAIEAMGKEVNVFFPENYGIPNYSELIYVVNINKATDARFSHFLHAIEKATAYLKTHQVETWQLFIQENPESNNSVNRRAWFATIPDFASNPTNFDTKEWTNFAVFLWKNNVIKKVQPTSRYLLTRTHSTTQKDKK